MNQDLHERLIAKQSLAELERKKNKALRKAYFTQETIDWACRAGEELSQKIQAAMRADEMQSTILNMQQRHLVNRPNDKDRF